ncbi:hypothetical protein ABL78_4940 [Leptomonas seymouri]|uniref:RING-type domain-containing protein n=1 Tax=Leptomonas seymouri TaxID=5684 RepID=A0A0N0P5H8_LEPSE|nr:hypothetical protein ABL78_4940 [Leptomonas seymouri]|eukprot:KPI86007.1 hypothetical protein ABL78_4940 [Leptomonas seymouri]
MSLSDMFQDRVNDVKETGEGLYVVMTAMESVFETIPDDDDVARQQRERRNQLRQQGKSIYVSDVRSCDGVDARRQGATASECEKPLASSPDELLAGTTDPAGEAAVTNPNGRSSVHSNDSFMSPASMRSGQPFPSGESPAAPAEAAGDSEGTDGLGSIVNFKARVAEEGALQLRIFDYDPRQWLLQFMCYATKHYGEETDRYLHSLHVLLNFMSVRRRCIELRSAALRERQQRAAHAATHPIHSSNAPTTSTTTNPALSTPDVALAEMGKAVSDSGAGDKDDDIDDSDESVIALSSEERRRVAIGLPDNVLRMKAATFSSFFTIYVTIVLRQETPVAMIKHICTGVLTLCSSLRAYPREPLDIVKELHSNLADQAKSFVDQWMKKGKGLLAPVMVSTTNATTSAAAQAHHRRSSSQSSSISSTVGSESVMDSEGRYLQEHPEDASDGSARAVEEGVETQSPGGWTADKEVSVAAEGATSSVSNADAVHPSVDAATARELVAEYQCSRSPCTSRLAQLVVDTVPGMDRSALLPSIEQPERHAFNDGYVRVVPFMTAAEKVLLTEWMQVQLSELRFPYNPVEEAAIVRAWASPSYDSKRGELTILMNPTNAFRMQLSNPTCFSTGGAQCDMCCLSGRNVSFQAVLENGVRSEVVIGYEGCVGFDTCVACSYYYYKSCEVRLLRAVHPNAAVRQPFAYGRYSKTVVQSVRVVDAAEGDAVVVEVMMGVSPFGVLPIGWVLPRHQLAALSTACTLTEDYVELTEAEHAALPVPDARWQERCRIVNVSKRLLGEDQASAASDRCGDAASADVAEADLCPICLQLLHSPLPVLRTLCKHWFHVQCIGSHYHYKPAKVGGEVNESNGCPVCRCTTYMPSLTDVAETLRTNLYKLEVRVPAVEVPFAIAVGTILTDDGAYHNATNIAACASFYDLVPGYVYTAEAASLAA